MKQVEERYISLLTDFGFKRIFGSAPNKDLLICFLNSLFNGRQVVKDVMYLNPEHVGDVYTDRRAIFDVYCEGENGEKFIVEMQNAYQAHFKDRSLFYSTFPIREQAPKGNDWDFKLNHVYTVALLNFSMNEDAFDKEKIRHHVQLCDTATHKIFYDKQEFICVEIAKFNKSLDELETLYDKWLYALKNLYKLTQRPKALCDKVFDRLFEEAEIARFTPQEQREYEASKMAYRDIKNSIDTAKREGKEEGLAEGIEKGLAEVIEKGLAEGMKKGMEKRSLEIARKMLAKGMDAEMVMEITGLSESQLQQLKSQTSGKYYVGKMVKGPAIIGCAGTNASVSLGVPTSNIDVCAFFHCHTTLLYCPETTSRITGPSQSDLDLAQSYNLPGILRDYKAPEITGGHDINDSYKDITFGPTKRPDIQYNDVIK